MIRPAPVASPRPEARIVAELAGRLDLEGVARLRTSVHAGDLIGVLHLLGAVATDAGDLLRRHGVADS